MKTLWTDKGYRGPFVDELKMLGVEMIIPAPISPEAPFLTKWRWVVERTFGWLNRYRRLSKDYEHLASSSRMWVIISMLGVMVRKLRPS